MSDYYYELVDADENGETFRATDLVRSTWTAAIQHGAPVSALLVRALERCAPRADARFSRVMIDLLGGVPAEGDLWVRARIDRPGRQIELVGAEMLAMGPDGSPRPVARASGWRMSTLDTDGGPPPARSPAAPAVRSRQPGHGEGLGPQLRPQHRLALADHADGRRALASHGSNPPRSWSRARR